MSTDLETEKKNSKAACIFVRLYTLNGRVSNEWILFIHGATPAMADELVRTVFPTTLNPDICKASGLRSGERYHIQYLTTTAQLTEEEVEEYVDGPGVIVIDMEVMGD